MKNLWCVFIGELSDEEVNYILQESENYKYQKASVGVGEKQIENLELRRSKIKFLNTFKSKYITDLIYHYAQIVNRSDFGFDINGVEDIQYTEYFSENEGYYGWHEDTIWCDSNSLSQRKISFTLQLSDSEDYEGGDFEIKAPDWKDFLDTLPEKNIRKKGTIILFPSFITHRVTPVTKGIRKSLVSWVDGGMFR